MNMVWSIVSFAIGLAFRQVECGDQTDLTTLDNAHTIARQKLHSDLARTIPAIRQDHHRDIFRAIHPGNVRALAGNVARASRLTFMNEHRL